MTSKPSNPGIDLVISPELLQHNFTKCEDQEIRVDFTEEEITAMKDEYFKYSSQLQLRQEMDAAAKSAINSGADVEESLIEVAKMVSGVDTGQGDTKSLKSRSTALLKTINHGYEIRVEKLYAVDYQNFGRMAWYDGNGLFVYDRPLKPTEKQTNIHSLKYGTNG